VCGMCGVCGVCVVCDSMQCLFKIALNNTTHARLQFHVWRSRAAHKLCNLQTSIPPNRAVEAALVASVALAARPKVIQARPACPGRNRRMA